MDKKDYFFEINDYFEATLNELASARAGRRRAVKGGHVEWIAEKIVLEAWTRVGKNIHELGFDSAKYPVHIPEEYYERLDEETELYLRNRETKRHMIQVDKHITIDGNFVIGIECKSYTENAMMKRILVDFLLLKQPNPSIDCVLLQLESQLTGDYNLARNSQHGSGPTHSLLAQFPEIDLKIITLLEGERRVNQEITLPAYRKHLEFDNVEYAVNEISKLLKKKME